MICGRWCGLWCVVEDIGVWMWLVWSGVAWFVYEEKSGVNEEGWWLK